MPKTREGLTPKQKRFAKAYAKTGNATASAKTAGYSAKTAGSIGHENLTKPEIRSYIDSMGANLEAVKGLTQEQIAAMLMDDAVNAKEGGTRVRAKELLGKWKNMFTDRYEDITLKAGAPEELIEKISRISPEAACLLAVQMGLQSPASPDGQPLDVDSEGKTKH